MTNKKKEVKQGDKLARGLKPLCLQSKEKILNGNKYIYNDSFNSKVLAVAHVDTVADHYGLVPNFSYDTRYQEIYSISLDDRLGVYTILNALPEYGIELDYVFTTDEEIGKSTARNFVQDHPEIGNKYNWIVEFDRRGIDPVSYIYEYQLPEDVKDCLTVLGLRMALGSFSDISEMGSLGICGLNWGIGYEFEHTYNCMVSIPDYFDTVLNFVDFYNAFADTKMPFNLVSRVYQSRYDYDNWDDAQYNWEKSTTKTIHEKKVIKGKGLNAIGYSRDLQTTSNPTIATGLCMDCQAPTSRWDGKMKAYICDDCRKYYEDNNWIFDDFSCG